MNKRVFWILLAMLISSLVYGQQRQVNRIKKELNKVVNSKEFSTAFIGFCLVDTETGKVLVEHNAEKSFTTASTMKLVTTGAALALLGDTFRFKTELGYIGEIKKGVLYGDVYLRGGTDPTTGSTRWAETSMDTIGAYFAGVLNAKGVTNIDGKVKLSFSGYLSDNIPPDYVVGDLPTAYGVPPFELNYMENYTAVILDTVAFPSLLDPDVVYDTIVETRYTPYSLSNNGIEVDERLPGELFVKDIQSNFNRNGIGVYDEPDTIEDGIKVYYALEGSYQPITTYYSPALIQIATKTNESSINLYAECILRAMGINKYGATSLDTCLAIAQRFWKNEVGDLKGLRMTDGSGLSRSNLCSPALMTKMLSSYTNRPNFGSFYSTLAVAGKTGTVANFCKGTAVDGNARIKSGSMSRVKCYAGYVTGKDGKLYAFTLMFNNFEPTAAPTAAAQKIIPLIAGLKHGKSKRYLIE